jgi:hypothetical protein
VDHFQPLAVEWVPGDDQIEKIWLRRLELAAGDTSQPISQFFESAEVVLPDTLGQRRLWSDFLVKSARERPRDMVQLMGKLIEEGLRRGATRIESRHMDAVIRQYSEERVEYVTEEFAQDCMSLQDVIRSLSRLSNVIEPDDLMKHLQKLPSEFRVDFRGRTLTGNTRDDAFVLWSLLHEAGVVNALIADARENRGFRHINYVDDPGLVSHARWNEMLKLQWEIHPAFRSFLQSIRESNVAAIGISHKQVLSRRKT